MYQAESVTRPHLEGSCPVVWCYFGLPKRFLDRVVEPLSKYVLLLARTRTLNVEWSAIYPTGPWYLLHCANSQIRKHTHSRT